MCRVTPDQIIAHVDLLRAVDGLLSLAEAVREKRDALQRLITNDSADERSSNLTTRATVEGGQR